MFRFSLTLSVLGLFLLLILQGGAPQFSEPSEDSPIVAVGLVYDADNGSDDSVLPTEKLSLIPVVPSGALVSSLTAVVLGLPVSSSLIRAPPSMPV